MMKKVSDGHNPHVVGMLGCVTLQEPDRVHKVWGPSLLLENQQENGLYIL